MTNKNKLPVILSASDIDLSNINGFIIDMDGVLWKGEEALPGFTDFFKQLYKKSVPFILATNNATLTQDQYVAKFKRLGVNVEEKDILTSSMATALHLSRITNPINTRVFVIGEQGARLPLERLGFTVLDDFPDKNGHAADYVVCALDRHITWDKMSLATLHIGAGAKFIATNADTTLPTERGNVIGNGSILAALSAATEKQPTVIGKPEPIMYQQAMELLGSDLYSTIAIGDRLDTDILGAVNAKIRSIMVLSGISNLSHLTDLEYQPSWILNDIRDITLALKN